MSVPRFDIGDDGFERFHQHGKYVYAETYEALERGLVVADLRLSLARWQEIHDALVDVLEGRPTTDQHSLVQAVKARIESLRGTPDHTVAYLNRLSDERDRFKRELDAANYALAASQDS